jgi:hypothetical protein
LGFAGLPDNHILTDEPPKGKLRMKRWSVRHCRRGEGLRKGAEGMLVIDFMVIL